MGTRLKFEVEVSDALAQEAARMGLLEPSAVQSMLREAVRARRIERLMEARKRIAASGLAPLTMEEIQAEVQAARAERRADARPRASRP
jgi:Arc/MetJ family transcription regulator